MPVRTMILAALTLLALPLPARAEPPSCEFPFGPGEHFTYRIEYLGITAGDIEITLGRVADRNGHKVIPIVATAETRSAFALFPVHDKFVSYLNLDDLRTEDDVLDGAEGTRSWRQRMKMDHDGGRLLIHRDGESKGPEDLTMAMTPGAVDVSGLFFSLRAHDLTPGSVVSMPVTTDTRGFTVRATMGEPTDFDGDDLGKRTVVPMALETQFSGKLEIKKAMNVLYTADAQHLPVRAEAEFLLGSVNAILVSHQRGTPIKRACPTAAAPTATPGPEKSATP